MYESPRLVPINTINAAYGNGAMSMGLCAVNVNAAANANAGVNVNAAAVANVVAAANAAAAANAVAVALVVTHYAPMGDADPRSGEGGGNAGLRDGRWEDAASSARAGSCGEATAPSAVPEAAKVPLPAK